MAIKDHLVFVIVSMCAATAAATWAVAEKVSIDPLKVQQELLNKKIDDQKEEKRSSPVIKKVTLSNQKQGNSLTVNQDIKFSDPEGDAVIVNYVILETNSKNPIRAASGQIDKSKEEQINGTLITGKWECGSGGYYVMLRAIIIDSKGNTSLPSDYKISCDLS